MKIVFLDMLTGIILFCAMGVFPTTAGSSSLNVLVVMSYHKSMPWVQEIKEGIDSEIGDIGTLKYFYMNTKRNMKDGPQKAKEAYALYREFQPDGVIAADDNAQSMFVVPYLKNKVKIPVVFCGVNKTPSTYGYPAYNVTGILERDHIAESIALLQLLSPSVKTIGYLMRNTPTTMSVYRIIQRESDTYPARSVAFRFPKNMPEAVQMTQELKNICDALLITGVESLPDANDHLLKGKDVVSKIAEIFGKPTTSPDIFNIKYGLLCTVSKSGREQGGTAAKMLLKAMRGMPVSDMPVTKNRYGKRVINVTVMKALGIKPRPLVLRGTELVRTED